MDRDKQLAYIENAKGEQAKEFYRIRLACLTQHFSLYPSVEAANVLGCEGFELSGAEIVTRLIRQANEHLIAYHIDWSKVKECPQCHDLGDGYGETDFCSKDCYEVHKAYNG